MKFLTLSAALALTAVSGLASAQANNPFSRPAPPAPVVVAPAPVQEPQALPPPPLPVVEDPTIREEVQASRIGVVNGIRIYRGSDTYVFEKVEDKKLVRIPATQSSTASDMPSAAPAPAPRPRASTATTPKNLPSMVGKPAPKQ